MFWGHTCLLYSEGTFYIPEVEPGSEVKLTGRYVPPGQLSVESENRRCSHPGFSAPACRTYDIKSIRMKTIDAYACFVYPFVKFNIDVRYTKCNLIAMNMQYLELYEINAYHMLKLWHKTITGNCRGLHRRICITLRIFSQIVWIIPQWSVIFPEKSSSTVMISILWRHHNTICSEFNISAAIRVIWRLLL